MPAKQSGPPPAYIRIILALFFILLCGSIFGYKLRMLFVDPCFVTFTLLNTHDFVIAEHRYGAFITQLFPMIAGWLQLPLSSILMIYSASFYIFYFGVILWLVYACRQYMLALLMAFYFTLFVSDGYFWPNNEVHQGIAWMFLSFGLLMSQHQRYSWLRFTLAMMAAFLAIFCHFIVFIPFTFLWLYFIFQKQHWTPGKLQTMAGSVLMLLFFFFKYQLGKAGWYDGEKLAGVKNISVNSFLGAFTSDHAVSMAVHSVTNYWIVPIMVGLSSFHLLKNKFYLLMTLYAGCMVSYFVLLCITFPPGFGWEMLFYMESQWMAFGIIAATPFVLHVLPKMRPQKVTFIIAMIFLVRLAYIAEASLMFNDRYQSLNATVEYLAKENITKAFVRSDTILKEPYIMDWGLPVESLTLSMMKGHQPPVTLKRITSTEILPAATDTFLSSFAKMDPGEVNYKYYQPDTTVVYQEVFLENIFYKK